MRAPAVSVVLPVYNRPAYLRPAIASVLGQTFADWELLVADDGSDDPETLAILADLDDPRIRVLRLAHRGSPAVARNAAIAEACGEYLAYLDSDDLWMPDKLARQLAAMRARPTCGWSYTAVERIDGSGDPAGGRIQQWIPYDSRMVERLLRIDALVAAPTVMMRRDLAEALGGFDVEQHHGEDYDLWIRAAMHSDVVVLDMPLAAVRVHPEHYSRERLAVHRGWLQLYDKFARGCADSATRRLARRRRAESELVVPSFLSAQVEGRTEAWRLLHRFGPDLLLQPRLWPPLARRVAGLLARSLRGRSRFPLKV